MATDEDEAPPTVEVVVGRIAKPHGLRGDVVVDVRTDEPDRRFARGTRLRAEPPRGSASPLRSLTVASSQSQPGHQSSLLGRFSEIRDRAGADAARGILLYATVPADERPEDPEEFYDHQLVGLAAYDLEGAHLGEVSALRHGAAQDLLVIRTPSGREGLVPFVSALVPEVDLTARRVVIADRPGLVAPAEDHSGR